MRGRNGGCIGAIATLTIGMIALGFIITMFVVILGVAILGGFIYLMYWLYKTGKFDNITSKTNELISKIYTKLFKKELEKNIFTSKSFACVVTVLVLGGFWLSVQDSTPPADIPTAKVEDTVKVESTEKENETQYETSNGNIDDKPKEEVNNGEVSEENTSNIVSYGNAELHFISTGNSDAILIEQSGKFALIDGGDNDDEGTVVNYLESQGVSELEYLIATHPHADHIGGLDAVVDNFDVKKALVSNGSATTKTYEDFIMAMSNKGVYPSVPLLGSIFDLGTSTFKVLSVANTDEPNNNSLVLLWQNGNDKVLLMGDAEEEIESTLDIGNVDLLKVGHHGSSTSSSKSFIDKVYPVYAVIQVGANNKYGHPHQETMDTLKSIGAEIHRNDECGTVVFQSTGNGITVDCKEGSTNSPNYSSSSSSSNSESVDIKEELVVEEVPVNGGTVYWTTNGKKYHKNPNCSRMKNPNSGTIEQSGREACSKCA